MSYDDSDENFRANLDGDEDEDADLMEPLDDDFGLDDEDPDQDS